MFKRIFSLAVAALLICGLSISVFAAEVPDLTKKGSISISMHSGDTKVGGGTLTLFRVGAVSENNGDYSFVPTGDFVDCGKSFADVSSSDLASSLAEYAEKNSISGNTQTIDDDGNITFADLELGLYLLVQEEAAEDYNEANPFLVTVPRLQDGVYIYDVEASPKVELTPSGPITPPDQDDEDNPGGSRLPQTGQLNWPIPVLSIAGLGLFALGWKLRSDDKSEKAKRTAFNLKKINEK